MKRLLWMLCLLALVPVLMTSCLKNDDDDSTTSYPDMAITSFTLGSMNRYLHQTSAYSGNDTVVKVTYTGSLYPMTIDHLNRTISNEQPLPVGTDTKHVICTVGAKNNGVVYLKRVGSDSLFYHQATDSVDLSQPRVFRVFAINGSGSRDYTVTLNVSTGSAAAVNWVQRTPVAPVSDMADKHLVAYGDSVLLVGRNVVVLGDELYGPFDGMQLLGASSRELYAYDVNGTLVRSADHGQSWQAEQTDEQPELLPRQNVAIVSWPYATSASTDYVLMVGNAPDGPDGMSIWRKIAPYEGSAQWILMTQDETNHNQLPRAEELSLACYGNTVLAMGNGTTIYQSRDQGITWQKPAGLALPATVQGTVARIAADKNGTLWVVTDAGQVWQGTGE